MPGSAARKDRQKLKGCAAVLCSHIYRQFFTCFATLLVL